MCRRLLIDHSTRDLQNIDAINETVVKVLQYKVYLMKFNDVIIWSVIWCGFACTVVVTGGSGCGLCADGHTHLPHSSLLTLRLHANSAAFSKFQIYTTKRWTSAPHNFIHSHPRFALFATILVRSQYKTGNSQVISEKCKFMLMRCGSVA